MNEHLMALQPEIAELRVQEKSNLFFSLFRDKIFPYLQCIMYAKKAPLGGELAHSYN
jgi:hypothetical protein